MKHYLLQLIVAVAIQNSLADHQSYPGTNTRPILSEDEAEKYTQSNYFSAWQPEEIVLPTNPDYVVKAGGSIQAVVNDAIKNGSPAFRTYIRIDPGMYMETVYIKGNIPLTIYGSGESPADVHIMTTLSSKTTTAEYKSIVNPYGTQYQEEDPAWSLYNHCANKDGVIGVDCSAVFWIESDDFQLQSVTIHNDAIDGPATAIKTSADKIHLMNNRFLGTDSTVGLGIEPEENNAVQRVFVHMNYIEGGVNYILGGAAAVFDMTTFNSVAVEGSNDLSIFAPDTSPDRTYGFLVVNCNITGDVTSLNNKVKLARSWDVDAEYVPGESPNGQLVIRETNIDSIISVEEPYASSLVSNREFSTDVTDGRDLDDATHNRFWEFANYGEGA